MHNTSKLSNEFHKISKDTRYVTYNICKSFFIPKYFLSVKDINAKKHDFLNPFFLLQKYQSEPNKNCIQQHAHIVTNKTVTSVIECF